jgi:endonuclease III
MKHTINLPDINEIAEKVMQLPSEYKNEDRHKTEKKPIQEWVEDHRGRIEKNKKLYFEKNVSNDLQILKLLFSCYLMRAMKGERGILLRENINTYIHSVEDLNEKNFKKILQKSSYRFQQQGVEVMKDVHAFFATTDYKSYFLKAQKESATNFRNDKILDIKNIGMKVRDLALLCFDENYMAIDLHLARIASRLGLLNYGYAIHDDEIEFGNNPANRKNYLFIHSIYRELTVQTKGKYSMSDFDFMLWHFGRVVCKDKPECKKCVIRKICMTGIHQ